MEQEIDVNKYVANKIKEYRVRRNMPQIELAEALNTTPQTISRYEKGDRKTNQDILFQLAEIFGISINDFFPPLNDSIRYLDISPVKLPADTIKIPVLGYIKAGLPITAQEEILDLVDIPKEWIKGGNEYFGLKIDGDSMYPEYFQDDIVIFKYTNDCESGNDVAVFINGYDATFKKLIKKDNGILLQPYNNKYEPQFFSNEEVEKLPVTIIGVVKQIRRNK